MQGKLKNEQDLPERASAGAQGQLPFRDLGRLEPGKEQGGVAPGQQAGQNDETGDEGGGAGRGEKPEGELLGGDFVKGREDNPGQADGRGEGNGGCAVIPTRWAIP